LTKISDLFRTAMMFLELERIERDSLSEDRDLKLNELMDFIFDGVGWDCHLGLQDLRPVQLWMGQSDLESTMRYLKPSRSQQTRDKVNVVCAEP
jgi:hypothetical protein